MEFLSPEVQTVVLEVIAVLTVAMPLLEHIVKKTATKTDDQVLEVLQKVLAFVPRIRFGGK